MEQRVKEQGLFRLDEKEPFFWIRLSKGPWAGRAFKATLSVCPNPLCECRTFEAWIQEDTDRKSAARECVLELEVFHRGIEIKDNKQEDSYSRNLVAALRAEMDDKDWRILMEWWAFAKQMIIREADPNFLDAVFPPEVLSGRQTMVAWDDQFPADIKYTFEYDGADWFVIDAYCVNPECHCKEVDFQFFRIPAVQITKKRITPACAGRYLYQSGTWEVDRYGMQKLPLDPALVKHFLSCYPSLEKDTKERHRRLRIMFKRALDTSAKTHAPVSKRSISLNQLCPCGSGKKYKRCCGKAAMIP